MHHLLFFHPLHRVNDLGARALSRGKTLLSFAENSQSHRGRDKCQLEGSKGLSYPPTQLQAFVSHEPTDPHKTLLSWDYRGSIIDWEHSPREDH